MNIKLNFYNRCEGASAPTVLVFQRDSHAGADHFPVAWKVIRNCGPGWRHPFTFSTTAQVNVSDADGNHLPPLAATGGTVFEVTPLVRGRRFGRSARSAPSSDIVVRNGMPAGAINANLYSSGAVVACKTNLAPGASAALQLRKQLWLGLAEAVEGTRFDATAFEWPPLEISLMRVASADIVLTDDVDDDSDGAPYRFSLENVVPL